MTIAQLPLFFERWCKGGLPPEAPQLQPDRRTSRPASETADTSAPDDAASLAMRQFAAGQFRAAVRQLAQADARHPGHPVLESLLALAMRADGSTEWKPFADAAGRLQAHGRGH